MQLASCDDVDWLARGWSPYTANTKRVSLFLNIYSNNVKNNSRAFNYTAPTTWNSLPADILTYDSESGFKGVLRSKKWISQNYTRRVVYLYTSYFG